MLELHSDELCGHHAISAVEKKGKLAKFKHHVFFNTTLCSYPRIYLPNKIYTGLLAKWLGKTYQSLNTIGDMSSQKNIPRVQVRHQTAWHFVATNLFVPTGLITCNLLQRQNSVTETRFSETFLKLAKSNMSLQHHIMLQHVTASCYQVFQPFTLIYRKMGCNFGSFLFDVVNTCSSHFTDFFGSFAWHIPFHLVHQQSSVWQYKHGSWSLNPLLFQNCHLWLWLKEQGSWLCMMHC